MNESDEEQQYDSGRNSYVHGADDDESYKFE